MSGQRQPGDAIDAELLAYALGEIGAEERGPLERRLERDPALRSRLAELRATVDALSALPGEAWDRVEPPPLDRPTRTAPPAIPRPGRSRAPRLMRAQRLLRPAALAGAALAIGVAIGVSSSSAPPVPAVVASADLLPIGVTSPHARGVFRLASDRTARLEVSGLRPTDGRHVYELWLMDSTRDLISVATFRVNGAGRAQITLPLPAAPSHFRYLDVSLQPLDGTALHSSESVLRGPAPGP